MTWCLFRAEAHGDYYEKLVVRGVKRGAHSHTFVAVSLPKVRQAVRYLLAHTQPQLQRYPLVPAYGLAPEVNARPLRPLIHLW